MTGAQVDALRGVRVTGPGQEFLFDDEPVDLVIRDGVIADIAPTGALALAGRVVDAEGAWVIPGLWDNHVHVVQWALASERTWLGDAASAREAAELMAAVQTRPDDRRIGTGFRDALWPDAPTRETLDAATGAVPTYLINADVHSVWLNSAALAREGFDAADGVLREEDAFEISRRLNAVDPVHADQAVQQAASRAAGRGITGVVDFEMAWNAQAWERRVASGFDLHRVEFAIYPADLDRAIAEGLRTGDALGSSDLVSVGRLKVISDGSLGTRTAACSQAYPGDGHGVMTVETPELIDLLTRAAGAGLEASVHAIGDRAAASALDAFAHTGAAGTIEHAQLVRHADVSRIARLGLVASVQPQHALDDRDMASRYWAHQTSLAYPLASLRRAGVELRLGSDAPVAPLDPWQAIAAAVTRSDDVREPLDPGERLSVDEAIAASVRTAVRPGERADLVLCDVDPRTADAVALRGMPVRMTLLGGLVTHG
ncbi:amidohydrolase [Microbacterium sp. CIAB417]|uniref:amidohydrolase n=1 Tax=Microbacterium sp. CIAB417 TaxID=2860287 RepID=UPI001FABA988|nr:amidohydrolase family protein [Microbacterium sp. CIAB417]